MSRLSMIAVDEAKGELSDLFRRIEEGFGWVPNAYATLGSNSPGLLACVLQTRPILLASCGLRAPEIAAINIAVSAHSKSDYCVAEQSVAARASGFSAEQTISLCAGHYPEDARLDALIQFALRLVDGAGTLPGAALEDIRSAGYSDEQIVGVIGAISIILFNNMFNRVNDTPIDFPNS